MIYFSKFQPNYLIEENVNWDYHDGEKDRPNKEYQAQNMELSLF